MKASWLLSLTVVLFVSAAEAQVCPTAEFGTPQARSASIEKTSQILAGITSRFEAVPPSEADYLDREERAALDAGNRARFNIVAANRFYRAYQIAKADREMKANLVAAAKDLKMKERVMLLSATLSKQIDLVEAVGEYMVQDQLLARPIQTGGAAREISYDLVILRSNILRNLQCTVQLMREP